MSKWLLLTAALCGLVACSDQDFSEDEAQEFQAQQTSLDGGTVMVTPTADGGAASAATGELGSACAADTDCKATGTRCVKQVSIPFGGFTIQLPGGLCTKSCATADQCGAGFGCPLAAAAAFVPDIAQCLKMCKTASDCRQGYNCAAPPALPFGGAPAGPAVTHCMPPTPPGLPF